MLFAKIVRFFGSAQAALGAGVQQLQGVEGIGQVVAERIARSRDAVDVAREVDLAGRRGVRILCSEDEEYPRPLRYIPDPPICLYVRGRLEPADAVAVAIVGSRRCTTYGREQAYRLGYTLGARGVTVISGLARGVDGESHKGALTANGRTLAVLGNGLGTIYPPEHVELADRITTSGAIVTELPMTAGPNKSNFLPRNRIIAGLSLGVLVVEAARRSGSLTTARLASEYDRDVFAIPGRIDSDFSAGTNALIRDQHAKLVTCAEDVLDELGEAGKILKEGSDGADESATPAATPRMSEDEQAVYAAIGRDECSIEAIAAASQRQASAVAATLITLQLKGLVRQLPGNLFMRSRTR